MADFCMHCSYDIFGCDNGDLWGLSTKEDTKKGLYCIVICEGCGTCQVDHEGRCISEDCLKQHGRITNEVPPRNIRQ